MCQKWAPFCSTKLCLATNANRNSTFLNGTKKFFSNMINGVMFWSMCSSGDFFWPLLKIFLWCRSSTVCNGSPCINLLTYLHPLKIKICWVSFTNSELKRSCDAQKYKIFSILLGTSIWRKQFQNSAVCNIKHTTLTKSCSVHLKKSVVDDLLHNALPFIYLH